MKKLLLALSLLFVTRVCAVELTQDHFIAVHAAKVIIENIVNLERENAINDFKRKRAAKKISVWFKKINSKKENPLDCEEVFAPQNNDQSTSSNTQLNDLTKSKNSVQVQTIINEDQNFEWKIFFHSALSAATTGFKLTSENIDKIERICKIVGFPKKIVSKIELTKQICCILNQDSKTLNSEIPQPKL